jgi:hypothetical protein
MQERIQYLKWAVLNKECLEPTEKFQIALIIERYGIALESKEIPINESD